MDQRLHRNRPQTLSGIETWRISSNIPIPVVNRNRPQTLSGIETRRFVRILVRSCDRNRPQTLSGIETSSGSSRKRVTDIEIDLKPFQGLKLYLYLPPWG